jgi:dipeptidyl aminopeptidase/acylaminoacyl peptidase
MMGFRLLPMVDPLLTFEQVRPLAEYTRTIYAELEADPDFHALGSVMPDAYNELCSAPFDHGHYFLYVPPKLDRSVPAPALVFLHGSGGNFKAYTWLLSRVADERGMILIAPSYGFGNWDPRKGPPAVFAALDDARKHVSIDTNRVHLAGLSNGGLGVSRTAASQNGNRFRSLILLSPVFDTDAVKSPAFAERWREKPMLVITGESDDRVPVGYVKDLVKVIRNAGANVDLNVYPQANHFLFFSHRDRCLKELSSWLEQHDDY